MVIVLCQCDLDGLVPEGTVIPHEHPNGNPILGWGQGKVLRRFDWPEGWWEPLISVNWREVARSLILDTHRDKERTVQ